MVNATSCQLLRPMVEAFGKLGIHPEEGRKQESVPVIINLAWQNHEFRLIDNSQSNSLTFLEKAWKLTILHMQNMMQDHKKFHSAE